jgi:hypothetical protein
MITITQGDVSLIPVDAIPATAKRRDMTKPDARTVALGESSGHGHIITGDVCLFDDGDGTQYIEVAPDDHLPEGLSTAAIEHLLVASGAWTTEHHSAPLAARRYEVRIQRQYDPYAHAIVAVED